MDADRRGGPPGGGAVFFLGGGAPGAPGTITLPRRTLCKCCGPHTGAPPGGGARLFIPWAGQPLISRPDT